MLTDYERRYIIELIEIRRQRLRNIMNNLFQSYVKYVILAYSKPPAASNCYIALRELDTVLQQIETNVKNSDTKNGLLWDHITKLLLKAKRIATNIGGETQVIVEDLIESLNSFYKK